MALPASITVSATLKEDYCMDHMDSLPERSEVFEPQTEALAQQVCVVARRQRSWRGIAGCLLVLGLLSLALSVRTVEAQGGQRNIPVSLCTTSADIIRMSGGPTPRAGELICPITEDVPLLPPKSSVDILRVNAFSSIANEITVLVCSQKFDDPEDTVCSSKGIAGTGSLPIRFTIDELANAWGPQRENTFGYVRIRFLNVTVPPQAGITGIFLFFD